jgi:hypothetical protein
MTSAQPLETELVVGARAIDAYSRLNYTMWYAFAEFIDNSTQSRRNYAPIIDDVLKSEGQPLVVEIVHDRIARTITITDNSIGMNYQDLIEALRIAHPTVDSKGRSKYGLGMKTAACWIGSHWQVVTAEWSGGEEWTATIDVAKLVSHGAKIPLSVRSVGRDEHYTKIIISNLHRNIQGRTEEIIRDYLGAMYRFDIAEGSLKIVYNSVDVTAPGEPDIDTDPEGKLMRLDLPEKEIGGKKVKGWIAVLRAGAGGRKKAGFSLFQEKRQIQGYPHAWKPRSIFGGVDDEGANNLIAQRLAGLIELDGFKVSHTKDSILFEGDEEEELEKFLEETSRDYRTYASKRRSKDGSPWSREKVRDLVDGMAKEFTTPEMTDAVSNALLPPLETIQKNNQAQLAGLSAEDELKTFEVTPFLKVKVSLVANSEFEPHLTLAVGADADTIHVIINSLHPYFCEILSTEAVEEAIRQYIYDAVAEFRVSRLTARLNPDSVRRLKDALLRVPEMRAENKATSEQQAARGDTAQEARA